MLGNGISRRSFLQMSGAAGALSILSACVATVPDGGPSTDSSMDMAEIDIWSYPCTENDLELVFKPLMERFHASHDSIKASIEVQPWGGRRESLYAAAAAGEAPDIWDATTDTIPAYVEKGVILGVSDHLTDDDLADYQESELAAASFDGELIMPLFESEVNGPAYSGGLLQELGIDPATAEFDTWQKQQPPRVIT